MKHSCSPSNPAWTEDADEESRPMRKQSLMASIALGFICTAMAFKPPAMAQNCDSPPSSWGNTSAYESWCKTCGGSVTGSGPRIQCTPGPDWGHPSSGGGSGAGAMGQSFYNLGYAVGQSIGKAIFGDPAEEAREKAQAIRAAKIAQQRLEAEAAARQAEDARKRQEAYDRLSSQVLLSGGFDGQGAAPPLMLGDSNDGLRPQGTSFFGIGGGTGGSTAGADNNAKVADLSPRQGYTATSAAPASPGDTLPLIMGDPNVVDLSDKKTPYIVDPKVAKGDTQLPDPPERMQGDAVISGINAQAKRLGWSADKLERLDKALNNLNLDDNSTVTYTEVSRVWQDVKARGQDRDIAQEASRGGGAGFPGAGTQTQYNDCTIFALANAARLPYGVVAARAAELIREAEWRSAGERANPQQTIEKVGLNGGEVIMLAEAFGQAKVVPPADFAATLKNGRQVLVNLAPGHEVVLTKAFLHGGETWYEMMNSYQSPLQRQYVSDKELNTLLLEKGVSFAPEPATVPQLLR
jgi:hypothetical protein